MHDEYTAWTKYFFVCSIADPCPPPTNVQLTNVNKTQLTFGWNAVISSCPVITYAISSTGCGTCPSTSVSNTTNCVNYVTTNEQPCIYAVQTVICGNVVSVTNSTVQVMLRGI